MAVGPTLSATGTYFAADKAADATTEASDASIAQQQAALAQQAELSKPYRQIGEEAIPKYEELLGLRPGSDGKSIMDALMQTPGYQFAQSEGQKGILNAASRAGGLSGNTIADMNKFNTGLASETYQQNVDNMSRAVGTGQAAAAGQAQNVGNSAANIGSTLINQGNTMAGIDANMIAGLTKAMNQGQSNNQQAGMAAAMLFL